MIRSLYRLPALILLVGLFSACAAPSGDRFRSTEPDADAMTMADAADDTATIEPPAAVPHVPPRKPVAAQAAVSAPTGEDAAEPQRAPNDEFGQDEVEQEELVLVMPQSPTGNGNGPQPEVSAIVRCREAVSAAQQAVNRYLDLPEVLIAEKEWVEEALRVTEVALLACQGQEDEQAATYWRATAFFLHGQYARAALNYQRVAEMEGPYNAQGYAIGLAELLEACIKDRQGLDDYRLGGLYEAAGNPKRAAIHYTLAARSDCTSLREAAEQRLKIVSPPDEGT